MVVDVDVLRRALVVSGPDTHPEQTATASGRLKGTSSQLKSARLAPDSDVPRLELLLEEVLRNRALASDSGTAGRSVPRLRQKHRPRPQTAIISRAAAEAQAAHEWSRVENNS